MKKVENCDQQDKWKDDGLKKDDTEEVPQKDMKDVHKSCEHKYTHEIEC